VAIFLAPIEEVIPTPINFLSMPSWRFIVRYAALRHGVDDKDILGSSRVPKVSHARQEAMALVRSHTRNTSLPAVGRLFGRDHTTVLHSIRSYEARRVA
jgi:chromosomal replication initiator protein